MLMFCVNPHHDYVFEIFHKTQYMSSNLIKCMVIVVHQIILIYYNILN